MRAVIWLLDGLHPRFGGRALLEPSTWVEALEERRLFSLVINPTFDNSVTSLANAAQIESAVNYAAQQFESLFSNPITINITVTAVPGTSTFGDSEFTTQTPYTYSQIRNALSSHLSGSAAVAAIASLPATDPTHGGTFEVNDAEAKALGLGAANDPASDGTFYFGTGFNYTFNPANRAVSGKYDFIGVAEHEIAHIMGRSCDLGESNYYQPLDLFRYAASGQRSGTSTGPAYFSIDGGQTNLDNFATTSDLSDWASTSPYTPDSFNAFAEDGYENGLTPADVDVMEVLGYTPAAVALPAAQLGIGQPPASATAGSAIRPAITVNVEDSNGSTVQTDGSTVTATIASGPAGATLGGTSSVQAVGGVATFSNLTLNTAGTYTLMFTDGALAGVTSGSFAVTAQSTGNSQSVVISQQPGGGIAGGTLGPATTVVIENSNGSTVMTSSDVITATLAGGPAGAVLGGTTSVQAVNGVARFSNLSLNESGAYALRFSDSSVGSVTSSDFIVTGVPSSQLVISQQPIATTAGVAINPAVTLVVVNSDGAPDNGSTVTATIASGPAGAALGGTTSVQTANSVATFSNLSLNEPGTYTLSFTDGAAQRDDWQLQRRCGKLPPPPADKPTIFPHLGTGQCPAAVRRHRRSEAERQRADRDRGSRHAFHGNLSIRLFADTGTSLDGSQTPLATLTRQVSLLPGKPRSFSVNIKKLPSTLANGTYHVLAEVVGSNGITDVMATTETLKVAAAFIRPAVRIGAVIPSDIASGSSGSISITVTNDGNVPASGVDITLSPSTHGITPIAGASSIASRAAQRILPGKSKTFRLHFRAAPSAPRGVTIRTSRSDWAASRRASRGRRLIHDWVGKWGDRLGRRKSR